MNKKIFYFYCVCLFFSILFTTNTLSAKIYYAPQGSSNPTIINIANDKNGEIDIKWLNMRSSNDTPSGTNQSYIIYLIYRKSDSDFSNADTQTVMSQGDLIDTVTQVINSGYPSTFTFWSDTSSNLENNKYYYYSIIALDRFDGFYSDASNTVSIKCDTQGPSIQSLYGSTHGNQDYVSKNNIQINLLVYENNSLASGNLYLNYGFKSDTASYIQLNNANSVPMTVSSAETQGFYYVSAILPVTLCGSDTVVVYWISGTDNSSGLNDEIIDYSLDGNIFTSSLLSNSLTDSGNANFLYIDAIAPVLTQVTSPDSYFGFIKGFDTSVVITVSDDMFIETGNFILHHKKQGGTEQTSVMNYNGTRYSGEFTGIIPLNSYSNKDIITFWVTGTDKAGNAVLSTTFITESTGKTVIVDSSGPLVSSFNILNSKDSSADLTFSKNSNADSMYSIELILSDSNPVDTVYLKFYSRQNNNDSTNYMTGSDTVYFIEISETNRITTPSIFLNDGIVYPAVYLKDYFGNITVYSDSQLFSATQLYENNCKTLQVNSVLPKIISITHINNDISDSNTSVSAGDSFIITFNNILDTSSISLIDTAIVNDNGKILGTISAFNWNNIYDSLILTLPADYILNTGDTFHLFETISDIFGNFADTSITSQIPDNAGPILKKVEFINNDYSQRYSTFITSGDTIVLKFSEPMDSSYLTNGIKLNLQDTIKINSGVSKNFGDTSLILWLDSSTLSIGIGYNKLINDGDRISLSNHMRDVYGNQADTLINSEYNAVLYDTIGLNIINAYLDTIYDSSGKTINVSFSEPIDLNTLIPSNFNSSKGIPDSVYLQNSVDTDKCYITFNTVVLAGSDWIALTNNIKDTSIFNNQSTILTNFIITDIDSPYIVSVTTLNNDTALGNTQLSDGDTIIIKFSEPMKFSELSKSSFIDSFPINGGISGDTYGDFNYTVSSDNKTLYISLGSGSSIFNGDTINPSPFVKDLSGNPDISSETNYILDNAGPIIISVAHLNYDTSLNSNLSVGDKILLSFSEPVLTSSFSSPNSSFLVNNISGNQFGSSINWSYTFNGNTVSIELTSGFTLKYNDIISLYTGIRDIHNNYADSFYNYVLTDSIPPYLLLSYFENCDTQYTSFSTGDTILLKFSEPIDTSSYNISNITFSDPSNSFGTGAASITLDSSFIKIILGTNSVLHNNDTVNISGIKDFNNNFNIKPFEINLYDTVPSMIINVTFTDADNNSEFSYGDTFTVFFSEPMDMSTLGNSVYSNFTDTALVLSGARNFGSNVSTLWIDNRNLNISLGNGFTVRHNDQFVLLASVIKDLNSVELSVASSGILKDTAGPQCLISYLDTVEDSYCKIIKSVFNVPIDTSTVTNLSYYTITGNTVFSATAVDSRTIKINAVNPINVSNQVITFSQNILDQNGSGNVTVSAQNIIDTSSPKILYSIINPVSSGDTLNKTIDIFFNESVNFTKASDIGNYSNLNISNITALDSNAVRITMNNQFKSINDSFYVSNITDLADSNIMANTYCIPVDLINPFLNSITVINNDSNTGFTYGDTIILYFSESINTSALTAANINTIFNSDFGDSSNSVLEWDYYNTVLKIQLGSSPSIIYPYYINPSNLITDYSGNTDSSSNKLIPDSYEPDAPYSVIMADSDVPAAFPGFDNDSSIYIYWNQPIANDIDSYAVYLSINSAPDSLVGYTANRYFSYTNLIYHNRYSAKIKSIDKSGKMSGFSAQSSIIISDSYCPVPGIPTHSDTVFNLNYDTDLTINWQWISYDTDILYYRIYIDSGAGFILYDSTANTNYRLTGTYRNNYSLKIDAVDWAGNTSSISGASIYVTIDTGNVTNPSVPVHSDNATSGYDNDTSLSFTWTPNPDADFGFYKIFYNYNSGQYIYSCTSAINSYNLIVNAAGAYSIKIYCIDSAGNQSSDSSVSSIIMVDTGVSPVNLISPANLYTNILNETFVWAASVDANTYIFQLSSDTFSTLKYSSEIQAATSSISLNLDSGVFQWRIISKDNAGNTAVSNPNQMCLCIDTFVRPPSLIYPSNNYDTINHQPSFQWTITDADTYIWYFGTDTGSGFNIIDSGIYNNTKNSDTVFSRVLSDTYFWYVYVIDNAGNTNVSMTYKIVLRGVDYFNSIYPSAGTETNNIIPRFEWESSISAVNYYIVYSLTSNFAQKYFSQTTDDTYLIPDTPIINNSYQGDTIFWYVVGTDSTGDTNFSGIKYFLIDTIADTAILISPSNLKESKDTFISFVWSKPVDSVLYKFQIDTDTNFDNDTKSINFISSIQQHDSVLEGQRTYYWCIKSSDRFGNFSYSDYNKLTIDYTVGKSVCVEPAGNSYFTDRTPIFRWAKVADADSYMLQLSAVPNFSYAIFSQYFYDTVYTLSTQLSDSIYYWRIISVDTAGNINYSDSSKFTVDNIAPVLLVSTDSNIIQSGQNYSGYIEEKNIDTGFIFINSDTFYLSFFQITDTIVMFNVNISVNPGINYVRLSVTDKVGLTDTSQYIIYLASNLVSYSQDTVYSISDTGSLIIQFNDGILSPSFGVSISNPSLNNFDTIYVGMNFKNTVVMPVRMMISSLADSNLIYDTINAVRASETKNSVIEIVLYDNNYSRIEENEDIFDTAYIEFEIDKNKINNLGTKSFGIFTVAPINNRWYEINNENMPGGKVISGNYIYTDTSVAAYIKHFSIYSVINASLISADNIGDNIVIYPNPYTPNKQGSGSISASAAGGIHFGLDNNSDGTIDNGLPLNTEIVIYTLLGEKVSSGTVLSNGITIWDAKDKNGTSCASGLYLAVIKHNGKTIVKKIAVVR